MKTILVVDDEPKITQLVRDYLEGAGFGVRVAHDGKTALSLAKTEKPDLIVLDLGLPQMDGLDFTREYRKVSNAPIIMLTARCKNRTNSSAWNLARTITSPNRSAPRNWWRASVWCFVASKTRSVEIPR